MNLRENHTVGVRQGKQRSISKGDVVIVKDDANKRLFWKLAVVTDLIVGVDQQVTAAVVKVSDQHGNTRLLRRSVRHLYPTEVKDEELTTNVIPEKSADLSSEGSQSEPQESTDLGSTATCQPRRTAALKGELKRKESQRK